MEGERKLDGWMETCGLFLSCPKQLSNHTLPGIPAAKIFHVMFFKGAVHSYHNSFSVFLLDKPLCCVERCMSHLKQQFIGLITPLFLFVETVGPNYLGAE